MGTSANIELENEGGKWRKGRKLVEDVMDGRSIDPNSGEEERIVCQREREREG